MFTINVSIKQNAKLSGLREKFIVESVEKRAGVWQSIDTRQSAIDAGASLAR